MTIVEKAAYLKGLTEGLGVEPDTREGKLWSALNDLLSDIAHEIEDLQATTLDYADALDEISEDLTYLEEITCDLEKMEDYDDEDYDDEASPCTGDCGSCMGCSDEDGDDEAFTVGSEDDDDCEIQYDGVMYDVTCPTCGEEISFDAETLARGSIECPICGELLEFDTEDAEDEDEIKF